MKKTIALILSLILCIALFAGCAGNQNADSTKASGDGAPETFEVIATEDNAPLEENEAELPVLPVEDDSAEPTQTKPEEQPSEYEAEEWQRPALAGDWTDCIIKIDDVEFQVFDSYQKFTENGWSFSLEDYNIDETYVLNPREGIYATVELTSETYGTDYNSPKITVGFINTSTETLPLTECWIDSIEVNATYGFKIMEDAYDFEVYPGLKRGMSRGDIISVLGEPNDVYESDEYVVLTYQSNYSVYLRLTVFEDGGLQGARLNRYL